MELFSEYFEKDHLLARIDARIKLMASLATLAMVLSYRGFALPLFVALLGLFFCLRMKVPGKVLLLRFAEPFLIASVILLLKFFFSGNNVLFSLDIMGMKFSGYQDGLWEGLMIATRIFGAVSVVVVLGFSTPFTEFMAGLSWFRVPRAFIEILMFAYRYIFVIIEDAMVIYHAQKNRLGYSNIRRGLNSFGIMTGSLILKAFENSQNTTVAMVQRGYDGTTPLLKHKPFRVLEVALSMLFIIIIGIVWQI